MPDPLTSPDYSRSKRARCSEIRRGNLEEGEPARPPPPLARAAGAQLRPQSLHVHSPVTRPQGSVAAASGLCSGTSRAGAHHVQGSLLQPQVSRAGGSLGPKTPSGPEDSPTGPWGQTPPPLPECSHHVPLLPHSSFCAKYSTAFNPLYRDEKDNEDDRANFRD